MESTARKRVNQQIPTHSKDEKLSTDIPFGAGVDTSSTTPNSTETSEPNLQPTSPSDSPAQEDNLPVDIITANYKGVSKERINFAVAVLEGQDDLARGLYGQIYGRFMRGSYDWLVIICMFFGSVIVDRVAMSTNPNASNDWNKVFMGITGSIIILVSHVDSWCKGSYLGADAAIGAVLGIHSLIASIDTGMRGGPLNINLPPWMFHLFIFCLVFLGKEFVSWPTAIMVLVNFAVYCFILEQYYPVIFMVLLLIFIRVSFKNVDGFMRRHKKVWAFMFYILLGGVFLYIFLESGKWQEEMRRKELCSKLPLFMKYVAPFCKEYQVVK
ncbi:uncharacterized protein LOC110849957 [Folsomia candida]|uniref:uncharacterized protein LOC110849957 n=1 Tax=Folsomia candida TaxID=158441 RepID=UPI000B8F98C7|nr:uncharacterized protein LOC110849957 [Folsomia candida]XP_021953132.1 uncharacterized protein LOC110849957 [Folsomia candida]